MYKCSNIHIKNIEYKLKIIYKYDSLEENVQKDFLDEINAFLPSEVNPSFDLKFQEFNNELNSVTKNKLKKTRACLENFFDKEWTMFIFLNMMRSFTLSDIPRSSSTETTEIKQMSLQNSYANSQVIFYKTYEPIKHFLITTGYELTWKFIKKLKSLIQLAVHFAVKLDIIEEKLIYVKTLKDKLPFPYRQYDNYDPKKLPDECFINCSIYSYRPILSMKFNEIFNVKNKFFQARLKIIEYRVLLQNLKNPSDKLGVWEKRTLISGPTFVRSEVYDKVNPRGIKIIQIKTNELQDAFLETKFYPDLDFIKLIKEKFWSNLSIEDVNRNLEQVKKELESLFDQKNWSLETLDLRTELQRKYAKLKEDEKIYYFLNNNWGEAYHLSTSNDYRGRKYYCSPMAFTTFKLSRFCFHYGNEGSIESPYFKWDEYSALFDKISRKYNTNLSAGQIEVLAFYLIGIGKLDDVRKKQVQTSVEDILKLGTDLFLNNQNVFYNKITNWDDKTLKQKIDAIEFECYRFGLDSFLKGDFLKRIILKDATASGYQIQTYLVGVRDESKLRWVNMGNQGNFVDTYLFIVKAFDDHRKKEKNSEVGLEPWTKEYFKRDVIKKFCMIIPYSAGFEECWKNIRSLVNERDIFKAYNLFKLFHTFIKEDLWQELGLEKSYKEFIYEYKKRNEEFEKDHRFCVESETARVDLIYYKQKKDSLDIRYGLQSERYDNNKELRTTRRITKLTGIQDTTKADTAFPPNLTHFYDSEFIRILHLDPYNLRFASVHDAYIVSSFDCGKLVHSYGNIFKVKLRFNHGVPPTCLL